MLPDYIRVIQGDGINYEMLEAILSNMKLHRWSSDNLAFGSGGALLQRLDRDTQKCAYKCSYCIVDGKEVSKYAGLVVLQGIKLFLVMTLSFTSVRFFLKQINLLQ